MILYELIFDYCDDFSFSEKQRRVENKNETS